MVFHCAIKASVHDQTLLANTVGNMYDAPASYMLPTYWQQQHNIFCFDMRNDCAPIYYINHYVLKTKGSCNFCLWHIIAVYAHKLFKIRWSAKVYACELLKNRLIREKMYIIAPIPVTFQIWPTCESLCT